MTSVEPIWLGIEFAAAAVRRSWVFLAPCFVLDAAEFVRHRSADAAGSRHRGIIIRPTAPIVASSFWRRSGINSTAVRRVRRELPTCAGERREMREPTPCKRCGQPIPTFKRRDAMFCSPTCRDRERLGRRVRTPPAPRPKPIKKCDRCGVRFKGWAGQKYCNVRCCTAAASERLRRRKLRPVDHEPKICEVCDTPFTSRRAHQKYCSPKCLSYIRNRRQIDRRGRKTDEPARVSAEMIAARAAVIRQRKLEELRQSDPRPNTGWH